MKLRVPTYYKEFRCIAQRCKDSCCIGWEIDIDEDTYDYYCSIPGQFGERLRNNMKSKRENSFRLKDGRCPFLNKSNLCEICIELGEEALSEVCTEYPRFTMEYGDVIEKCMALSCEEVGRLIFQSEEPFCYEEMEQEACYDMRWEEADSKYESEKEPQEQYIEAVEVVRDTVFRILRTREIGIEERLIECLLLCQQIQEKINAQQYEDIVSIVSAYSVESFIKRCKSQQNTALNLDSEEATKRFRNQMMVRMRCFETLEILDEEWRRTFSHAKERLCQQEISLQEYVACYEEFKNDEREREYEHLLNYFVFRYFMRAVYDCNLVDKMKFAALSYLCLRDFDIVRFIDHGKRYDLQERIDLARIYSKEVEHSEENIEQLFDLLELEEELQISNMIHMILLR